MRSFKKQKKLQNIPRHCCEHAHSCTQLKTSATQTSFAVPPPNRRRTDGHLVQPVMACGADYRCDHRMHFLAQAVSCPSPIKFPETVYSLMPHEGKHPPRKLSRTRRSIPPSTHIPTLSCVSTNFNNLTLKTPYWMSIVDSRR